MVAVGAFMALQGVPLRLSWLVAVPALALLLVYVSGLAMLLSALFVRYRDVQPIWEVVVQAMFYATPILYPIETVAERSETAAQLIMCNPLASVIQQVRHDVFDSAAPTAAEAIGGVGLLLIPIGITIGTFVLGFYVFNRMAPQVAEEL